MSKVENAVLWMLDIAADDSHGYDQTNRWGPNYDCSSMVISAFEQAGIPVKTNGATYTGNMKSVFLKCGFKDVTSKATLSTGAGLQRGDVLLHEANHTATFVGDGQIVHASINENGGVTGGKTGDQTGKEICTRSYYNYPWDCVLRYEEGDIVITTTSQTGIDLIKQFEGCRLTAYKCSAGVWTIGYGHTSGVTSGMTITQAQAEAYLKSDLAKFESHVSGYNATYAWNQNEFDALVSFAFNIGNIDQLTANGTRSRATIASKMLEYNKAGGAVVQGLVTRRAAEQALFLKASSGTSSSSSTTTTTTNAAASGTVADVQTWLNNTYNTGLTVDNIYGSKTKAAHVKALQTWLNVTYNAGLVVDGIYGAKTKAAIRVLKKGNGVKILQGFLICNGYDTGGFDGDFGSKTDAAVRSYQGKKGLTVDGQAGQDTFTKLAA